MSHGFAALVLALLMGAAMSAAVVCARAMVRDLYEPHEGGMVMARALTGLGAVAIASPLLGGVLVHQFGWRAAVGAMGVAGAAIGLFIVLRMPETARHRRPEATQIGPLLCRLGVTLRHPGFRAWATLVSCTCGGLYIFLAGSVGCGAWFTLAACVAMLALAGNPDPSVLAVMAPVWLYALGHGIHMPCGQAGAVGPFPRAAGLASALAGFVTAAAAFGIGLWLGRSLDGTVRPFALGMGSAALLTVVVAWTLVRRHGEQLQAT